MCISKKISRKGTIISVRPTPTILCKAIKSRTVRLIVYFRYVYRMRANLTFIPELMRIILSYRKQRKCKGSRYKVRQITHKSMSALQITVFPCAAGVGV